MDSRLATFASGSIVSSIMVSVRGRYPCSLGRVSPPISSTVTGSVPSHSGASSNAIVGARKSGLGVAFGIAVGSSSPRNGFSASAATAARSTVPISRLIARMPSTMMPSRPVRAVVPSDGAGIRLNSRRARRRRLASRLRDGLVFRRFCVIVPNLYAVERARRVKSTSDHCTRCVRFVTIELACGIPPPADP